MKNPAELLIKERELKDNEIKEAFDYAHGYRKYLDNGKTEREVVNETIEILEKNGFVPFDSKKKYSKGDKIYKNNRGKALFAAVIGENNDAPKILAAHIDSPRLDLKQRPLYEEASIGYFKTHYYGGIKKYQWTAIPLALHGVVVRKNGEVIDVCIGEKDDEPRFTITDLLPHLAQEQAKRPLSEGIKGEELNVLVGSFPFKSDKESEKIKLNIINLLNEKYGIDEWDLFSAELCLVPSFPSYDIGLDRSMIGAYGHDDRVCAYPSLTALLEANGKNTSILVLADKEEIGSDGNTGLAASTLEYFLGDLAETLGLKPRDFIRSIEAISSDVTAAFDPTFPDVYDKLNSAFLGKGVAVEKYTGARGKYDTSDASAEFTARIRAVLDKNDIMWQVAELGKVDAGGGGTVAKFLARMDMNVIDMGVPVLSMHAPFEVISKIDIYASHKAFLSFLND